MELCQFISNENWAGESHTSLMQPLGLMLSVMSEIHSHGPAIATSEK